MSEGVKELCTLLQRIRGKDTFRIVCISHCNHKNILYHENINIIQINSNNMLLNDDEIINALVEF